jgi:AcrR family transcriptional regulator
MRENVREKILAAALKLLNEQGFPALTQTRVAEVAGVRQSHLTYYFPTRNELLKAIVQEGKKVMLSAMPTHSQTQPLLPDAFEKTSKFSNLFLNIFSLINPTSFY